MRLLRLPAVMPAVGALAGATYAIGSGARHFLPFVLLLLLGLALRRREGWWVAWLAAGALSGALRSPGEWAPIDPGRPVEARLRLISPWKEGAYGWSCLAAVEALRQGRAQAREPQRVWLEIGGGEEPPPEAGILEVKGTLKRRQAFRNDPTIPPGPWRIQVKSRRVVEERGAAGPLLRASRYLRRRAEGAVAAAAAEGPPGAPSGEHPPALALVRALLLGDPGGLPQAWVRALRRSGLGHLLAISGLHTAAVLLLAAGAGRLLPRFLRLPLTLGVLAAFVLLVGPRPSVLRAAVMALLGYGALLLGRAPTAVNALGCYVLATVLLDPRTVADLGFRLSVGATAGLLVLAPWLAEGWKAARTEAEPLQIPRSETEGSRTEGSRKGAEKGARGATLALAATAAAQVATVPFAVPAFSVLHPASALLNLLALPWIGAFLAAGILWTLLALVSPAMAGALLPGLEVLALPVEGLARLPALPLITLPWVAGPLPATLGASVLLAAYRWPRRVGGPLVLLLVLGVHAPGAPADPQLLVFDVGQGEAILLRSAGRTLLIDGGGSHGGGVGDRVLVPALARLGVRRLDAVALTHPDGDHCLGLVELADYLPVGALLTPSLWRASDCSRRLEEGRRIPWRRFDSGRVVTVGEWRLEALSPPPPEGTAWSGSDNDGSLVLVAEARGVKVLLTGDLERAGERRLLARHGRALESDVLKVAHHGSRSSTDPSFLRAVAPRLALISAGRENRFGHPHPAVLDRLERQGTRTLRTDLAGAVRLTLGPGGEIRIHRPGWTW